MIETSPSTPRSDTDSDTEPNTTDANIFWGHVKTPEKSRMASDLPRTILRPRSTLQMQDHGLPLESISETFQRPRTPINGGIGTCRICRQSFISSIPYQGASQPISVHPGISTENSNLGELNTISGLYLR